MGVADASFLGTIAGALAMLGTDRALVVCGEDGVDELSICAPTHVVEVQDGRIERYVVDPAELGFGRADPADVAGGTPEHNAALTRAILAGEPGAPRELAVLNAGAAIYAAGNADSLAGGVELARQTIDSGDAERALQRYVELSRELAPT